MSLPMPGATSVPSASISSSIARTSGGCTFVAGLTSTRPATSGWARAVHSASAPPMLRPATTMRSARSARRRYAASTSPVQSAQPVVSMSSIVVPWPGSTGSSTWKPPPAIAWASPRIDDGLPVKPCSASTPAAPSSVAWCDHGSAPGRRLDVIPTFYRLAPAPVSSAWWRRRSRQIEASAVAAIGPVLVIAPFCLLALLLDLAGRPPGVGRVVLVVRPRLRGRQRAAVRAPDPGVRADPAVRCPPADRRRARADVRRSGGPSPSPTTCRPTATSSASCRATSSTPTRAAATSSSSPRSPSPSSPAASSPACSPTSSATTSACTPSA